MKIITFGELESFEKLVVAKYLGGNIFFYRLAQWWVGANYIKISEADFDKDTEIYVKDFGETLIGTNYGELFDFNKDELRYDEEFIALVESSGVHYQNIDVHEVEDGTIFRINYDYEWGRETLDELSKPEWFEVKNGKKVAAF